MVILVYRPQKIKILIQNHIKMQNSILPKFELSILGKFDFQKNAKSAPHNFKKYEIGTSKPSIGSRFGIFDLKINFLKSKIDFSNSSRILLRDLKI